MDYRLVVTGKAKKQLDQLVSYLIFQIKNSQAAQHLLEEVEIVYRRLKNNPKQFPRCQDTYLWNKGYRKAVLPTMNYIIIFRIEKFQVYVLGIFHDSENYNMKL